MKTCNKCNKEKQYTEFFKDKNSSDGRYSICKLCKTESTYKWRENNKNKYNQTAKNWRDNNKDKEYGHEIKRRYGIDLKTYNKMLIDQDYKCAICNKKHDESVKRGRLYVDHSHKSLKVRKLLCATCNSMLGFAEDNQETLQKAIDYLKKHLS
jgi:hypothetical protein